MATTINSGYANSPKLTANIADHADVYGGRALVFDGVTDYLDCGTGLATRLGNNYSGDLSISLWMKPNGHGNDGVFNIGNFSNSDGEILIVIYNNELGFHLNSANWRVKITGFNDTNWNHLVCVYKSGSEADTNMYLNGSSVGSKSGTFPSASDIDLNGLKTIIGAYYSSSYPFNGSMADVKIFDSALTEAQVQELYKKPENTPSAVQDNLVAWYPMCEGNPDSPQSIVYDHSEKKLGSELVTGGDMSNLADAGTLGYAFIPPSNWTFKYSGGSNGSSTQFSVADNGGLRIFSNRTGVDYYTVGAQGTGVVTGKVYKLTFDAKTNDASKTNLGVRYSNGSNMAYGDGGLDVGVTLTTSFQTFTYYFSPTASNSADRAIHFGRHVNVSVGHTNSVDATIDNVSVKEVLMGNHATTNFFGDELVEDGGFATATASSTTGAYWTTGSAWDINTTSSGKAYVNNTGGGNNSIYQSSSNGSVSSNPLTAGKTYRTTGTAVISSLDAGTYLNVMSGGSTTKTIVPAGSTGTVNFDEEFVADTGTLQYRMVGVGSLTLDDVTVREVGISSSGFETAVNEPVVPQVPLMRYNQKAIFDRNKNTYVSLTEQTLEANTAFTIAFSFTPFNNAEHHMIGKNSTDDTIRVDTSGAHRIAIRINNDFGSMTGTGDVNANQTHFCVITRTTGGVFSVYRNGVKSTASFTNTSDFKYQYLGQSLNGGWESDGLLDEFSIFNTHFSDAEAQELFNDGVALDATTHSKKGNLLGYWRNDGVTTWQDRRGWSFLDFDGTGDYVTIGSTIGDMSGKDVSVTVWFNSRDITQQRGIISQQNGTGTGRFLLYNESSKLKSFLGGAEHSVSTNLQANKWHHACYTMNSSTNEYKLYLDGQLGDSGTDAIESADGDFVIGSSKTLGAASWNGGIAQLALFDNKTLSADEVLEQYNNGVATKFTTEGMTHHYVFNDDTTIVDLINSSNGTVNGNPTLNTGNNGSVQGSPDSITIREGLNSNRDGLGFYFTNPSNNVLRLNGSSEFIAVPPTDMGLKEQMTIECWAKHNTGDSSGEQIVDQYDYSNNQRSFRLIIDSSEKIHLDTNDNGNANYNRYLSNSAISNIDNWRHYAVTFSSGTVVMYVDGEVQANTQTSSGGGTSIFNNTTDDIKIGSAYSNLGVGVNVWNGLLDEFRIYNRALSADEINKNYKHQKGKHKND